MTSAKFTEKEQIFLKHNDACRLATCHNDIPHVVPVSYIFDKGYFYIATDYETRKYKNIQRNNHVALDVDIYSSVVNKAICVQGLAEIIEHGTEFHRLYSEFLSRFAWVRDDPWKEGEAPFIKVKTVRKVSWGL